MQDQEHSGDSMVKYFGLWTGIILIISSIGLSQDSLRC